MKVLDRIITLLMLVTLTPVVLLTAALAIVYWDQMPAVGAVVGDYGRQAVELAFVCLRLVVVSAAAAAAVVGYMWLRRQWIEHNRQRDGSHRLRTYKRRDPVTGKRFDVLINPDLMVAPALAISDFGVRELGALPPEIYAEHAKRRAAVAEWQAKTPGDAAISTNNGSMYRMGGLGGSAKPIVEKPERPALPAPHIVGAESPSASPALPVPAEPMQLGDALRQSNPDQFVLGHNPDAQKLAIWSPTQHLNLGVFGVSGTGKTKSTGYQAMLLAARHGYHVVCLDPKGGVDFGAFAPYVEWQPTDAYAFADQLNTLYDVHDSRQKLMQGRGVGEWYKMGPSAGPEIVVVLEEFGSIREEIGNRKGGGRVLGQVDHTLEMMFRLARMTGFHFIILDQAPEKLDQVVRGGCKMRVAYQLDTAQASLLREYGADTLPAVGTFMSRRVQYQSWLCETQLPQLLQRLQPFGHERLLPAPAEPAYRTTERPNTPPNATERPAPEVANDRTGTERPNEGEGSAPLPPLPDPPFDVRSAPKRDLIMWWRDHYPTGSQAEFRTWLADHGGSIAKGYISDTFAQWAEAQPAKLASDNMTLDELRARGLPIAFQGANNTIVGWDDKE